MFVLKYRSGKNLSYLQTEYYNFIKGLGQDHERIFSFGSKEMLNLTNARHPRDIAEAIHKRKKYSWPKNPFLS